MKKNRRSAVKALAIGTTMAACVPARGAALLYKAQRANIRQSVVPWCFRPMPAPELIGHAAALGLKSVELVGAEHWPLLKENGLVCAITSSHGFAKGFAHPREHDECIASLRKSIDATSAAGWPSVITFSGFRRGLSDDEGIRNMVAGLKKIVGYAEEKKVTLCLEMLNSRVDVEMKGHPDYFCDDIERTVTELESRGVEVTRPIEDQGWGILTTLRIPGGGEIGLYEPRHPTALRLGQKSSGPRRFARGTGDASSARRPSAVDATSCE